MITFPKPLIYNALEYFMVINILSSWFVVKVRLVPVPGYDDDNALERYAVKQSSI